MQLHCYIGSDGVAHRVKKGYMGVNGIAKRILDPDPVVDYRSGSASSLSNASCMHTTTKIGNQYMLFAGGQTYRSSVPASPTGNTAINAYNQSCVKSTGTLGRGLSNMGAANLGAYAVICGGYLSVAQGYNESYANYNDSYAYNTSLVRTSLHDLNYSDNTASDNWYSRTVSGGGVLNSFALFNDGSSYDINLVYNLRDTSTYALGYPNVEDNNYLVCPTASRYYNKDMVKTSIDSCSAQYSAKANGRYFFFYNTSLSYYSSNFVKSTITINSIKYGCGAIYDSVVYNIGASTAANSFCIITKDLINKTPDPILPVSAAITSDAVCNGGIGNYMLFTGGLGEWGSRSASAVASVTKITGNIIGYN